MRYGCLLLVSTLPVLAGCQAAAVAVDAASITVFGRDIIDGGVSAVTGKDCSLVRLDRGQYYCAPDEHPPAEAVFCTQTIGSVSCWSDPDGFGQPPRRLADTPPLTAEQSRAIQRRWPKSLNFWD